MTELEALLKSVENQHLVGNIYLGVEETIIIESVGVWDAGNGNFSVHAFLKTDSVESINHINIDVLDLFIKVKSSSDGKY